MSSELYSRGLWWNGERGRGLIKDVEFTIALRAPPNVLPSVAEIDYGEVEYDVPMCCPEIREHAWDKRRQMEAHEIVLVKAWLAELRQEMLQALVHSVTVVTPKPSIQDHQEKLI